MQEATFLILTALADGSQHGYGIITDVQQISGGRVRLRAGTLYTALDRLRADGLIGVDREEVVDGRLRRYYRLTPAGTGRLADEAARLQAHAGAAPTAGSPLRSSRLRVLLAAAACYGAAAGILNLAYCPGTVTSGTSGPASRPRPSGPRSRAAI